MRNAFLILLSIFVFAVSASAQQVEALGKVERDTVAVGKPFTLDLEMKVPYGYYVEWNPFTTDALSGQIDIVKRGEMERTADADSNIIVRQQLTLMTFDTGAVQVPDIGLVYAPSAESRMRMEAFTQPLMLYATTISVDTTQGSKPIVEPIGEPITMREVFPWILGLFLLVLLVILFLYLRKRRKTKYDEHGNVIEGPVMPPYEKALDGLDDLKQRKLWQSGKLKEYFSLLTDIAREYIEGQFGVNAVEMTTDDILQEIKPLRFDTLTYSKLKDTMELSDLVKFAKFNTSSLECDVAMNNMTDFVKESYAHYQDMKAREAAEAEKKGTCSASEERKEDNGHV